MCKLPIDKSSKVWYNGAGRDWLSGPEFCQEDKLHNFYNDYLWEITN
nr:MAG TPA: hypothetical protein [Caudoviricetes sp.]